MHDCEYVPLCDPSRGYILAHTVSVCKNKSLVYATPLPDVEILRECIPTGFDQISTPEIFNRVRQSMRGKLIACIEMGIEFSSEGDDGEGQEEQSLISCMIRGSLTKVPNQQELKERIRQASEMVTEDIRRVGVNLHVLNSKSDLTNFATGTLVTIQ
ncbi:hypothetical protein C0J52_23673 [Blattella germanica]|nr:hypothetical protein C0J52_23673 [Blattella germanica]